jgi:hypothetical protein
MGLRLTPETSPQGLVFPVLVRVNAFPVEPPFEPIRFLSIVRQDCQRLFAVPAVSVLDGRLLEGTYDEVCIVARTSRCRDDVRATKPPEIGATDRVVGDRRDCKLKGGCYGNGPVRSARSRHCIDSESCRHCPSAKSRSLCIRVCSRGPQVLFRGLYPDARAGRLPSREC